jgi:hypothetical protein
MTQFQLADAMEQVSLQLPVTVLRRLDHEVARLQANEPYLSPTRAGLMRHALCVFLEESGSSDD